MLVLASVFLTAACASEEPRYVPGDAGVQAQRVFFSTQTGQPIDGNYELCREDAECGAGQRCFHFEDSYGVCDDAAIPSGLECSVLCGEGQPCRLQEVYCSCRPSYVLACVEPPCTTDTDCGAGMACVPSSLITSRRCVPASCTRDEDCQAGPRGRCALFVAGPQQQGENFPYAVDCAYGSEKVEDPRLCGAWDPTGIRVADQSGEPGMNYFACEDDSAIR